MEEGTLVVGGCGLSGSIYSHGKNEAVLPLIILEDALASLQIPAVGTAIQALQVALGHLVLGGLGTPGSSQIPVLMGSGP